MKWCVCVCVCVCVYMCVCCNPDPNETVWMWAFLLCRASRIHLQCCVRICSHLCAYGRSHFCKVCLTVIHVYLNSHLCQCIFEHHLCQWIFEQSFVPVYIWTVICASVYLNSICASEYLNSHLCQCIFEQSFVPVYIWTVICASVYLNSHLCHCWERPCHVFWALKTMLTYAFLYADCAAGAHTQRAHGRNNRPGFVQIHHTGTLQANIKGP